jgi:plasmid stabilization system protein ParE
LKFTLAPQARQDLHSAVSYLLDRNPSAAAALKNHLIGTIEQLARGDFDGPEIQLRSGRWVRSWPVPPYRIYYQRTADALRVLRVYHQARRPIVRR